MARAWPERHRGAPSSADRRTKYRRRDWRKSMSDNIAYALLIYTGLQIFVTMQAIKGTSSGSALPYLALIVLVAAIIPGCRHLERRWEDLSDPEAVDPALRGRFRRDQLLLWLLAIGLPFALTALFEVMGSLF